MLAWNPPVYATLIAECGLSKKEAGLSKKGQRFLSLLDATDPSAEDALIRKFLSASSKSLALSTLSHLLSDSNSNRVSSFALPMYRRISETPWFRWNPKLTANVVALLHNSGQSAEAEMLISDSLQKLNHDQDNISLFYCELIESYSNHGLKQQVFDSYNCLKKIPCGSSATEFRCYKSMIRSLCTLGLPREAEEMLEAMGNLGFGHPAFEYRLVLLGYGRAGLFSDMRRLLQHIEDAGCSLDTVSMNIVLSCYGNHGELSETVCWLRKMRGLNIAFSFRTYNSVLNSCPTIMSMLQDPKTLPLSIEGLISKLTLSSMNEVLLIQELMRSEVLVGILQLSSSEGKLDLHGMHLGSAYLILLQWMEVMRMKFSEGMLTPLEISVVCGSGKHSSIRGESPIKLLVSEMMFRLSSPLKIDRRNVGRLVARGKAVKDWLCRRS